MTAHGRASCSPKGRAASAPAEAARPFGLLLVEPVPVRWKQPGIRVIVKRNAGQEKVKRNAAEKCGTVTCNISTLGSVPASPHVPAAPAALPSRPQALLPHRHCLTGRRHCLWGTAVTASRYPPHTTGLLPHVPPALAASRGSHVSGIPLYLTPAICGRKALFAPSRARSVCTRRRARPSPPLVGAPGLSTQAGNRSRPARLQTGSGAGPGPTGGSHLHQRLVLLPQRPPQLLEHLPPCHGRHGARRGRVTAGAVS